MHPFSWFADLASLTEEISKQREQIIKAATRPSRLRFRDVLIRVDEVP